MTANSFAAIMALAYSSDFTITLLGGAKFSSISFAASSSARKAIAADHASG